MTDNYVFKLEAPQHIFGDNKTIYPKPCTLIYGRNGTGKSSLTFAMQNIDNPGTKVKVFRGFQDLLDTDEKLNAITFLPSDTKKLEELAQKSNAIKEYGETITALQSSISELSRRRVQLLEQIMPNLDDILADLKKNVPYSINFNLKELQSALATLEDDDILADQTQSEMRTAIEVGQPDPISLEIFDVFQVADIVGELRDIREKFESLSAIYSDVHERVHSDKYLRKIIKRSAESLENFVQNYPDPMLTSSSFLPKSDAAEIFEQYKEQLKNIRSKFHDVSSNLYLWLAESGHPLNINIDDAISGYINTTIRCQELIEHHNDSIYSLMLVREKKSELLCRSYLALHYLDSAERMSNARRIAEIEREINGCQERLKLYEAMCHDHIQQADAIRRRLADAKPATDFINFRLKHSACFNFELVAVEKSNPNFGSANHSFRYSYRVKSNIDGTERSVSTLSTGEKKLHSLPLVSPGHCSYYLRRAAICDRSIG
ncbi:MAG: hypothetical protein Q3962_09085 [Corynebacterium sp.]|nr:hypothetical protein [Corynebacterium sp.]